MTARPVLPEPAELGTDGAPVQIGRAGTIGVRGPAGPLERVVLGATALGEGSRDHAVSTAAEGPEVELSVHEVAPPRGAEPVGVSPTGEDVDEGYLLEVVDGVAHLRAASPAGIFRGLTTVLQLAEHRAGAVWLPGVRVRDEPLLAWRGLSLDIVRDFRTVAEIEAVIDLLALYKLNVLHLHLTDSQAWRLASPAYPQLTAATEGDFLSRDELRHL